MEKKTIGAFISALRRAAGMTQRDLAERLNVSDKAVSRWERDESAPDLTLLPMIADLFGITVDELLRGQRSSVVCDRPTPEQTSAPAADTPASRAGTPKYQRMLFANRLRRFKLLNYIPIGLFALGVAAALLCNFAFYRASIGFFLGVLLEAAAAVCASAFAAAALPAEDDDYDTALLQDYKRAVVRTASLPLLLCTLTLPLLIALLIVWLEGGAYVGLSGGSLPALLLITLCAGLLLRELARFVVCPAAERRIGIEPVEKEEITRHRVGRLARRCALGLVCAMILPTLALGVLTCGMLDRDYAFADARTFDDYDAFCDYMASEGKYGTTEHWGAFDYLAGGLVRELQLLHDGSAIFEVVQVAPSVSVEDVEDAENVEEPTVDPEQLALQHRVIEADGKVLAEFDWINADVAYIEWSFNAEGDNHGLPISVYTADAVMASRAVYASLRVALIFLMVAIPVTVTVTYAVKRRRL